MDVVASLVNTRSGAILQLFMAVKDGRVVGSVLVDHTLFPSASAMVAWCEYTKTDYSLNGVRWDYLRSARQEEFNDFVARIQNTKETVEI